MKCVCGGKLKEIKTSMELFGGKVVINDIKAHYCPDCKEELFDSKKGDKLYEEVSKLGILQPFESRKKITKVGNSFAVPISKDIADFMQMKKGGEIRIKVQSPKRLVVDIG